jgi:CRISPR-associated endonuclease/helicase Cas3
VVRYPEAVGAGVILRTRGIAVLSKEPRDDGEVSDDGDDVLSVSPRGEPIALDAHLADVLATTRKSLRQLPLDAWLPVFESAAALHDWGKADERFQALLLDGDLTRVWAQPVLLAKSAKMPETPAAYSAARERATLPSGFRHEMCSVQLALTAVGKEFLPSDPLFRDLTLHLIASHHGYARPFAPVVMDDSPPAIELSVSGTVVRLNDESRRATPPHRLDSGIPDRFWELTRALGWWDLPYLESVLRLADQEASESPAATPVAAAVEITTRS